MSEDYQIEVPALRASTVWRLKHPLASAFGGWSWRLTKRSLYLPSMFAGWLYLRTYKIAVLWMFSAVGIAAAFAWMHEWIGALGFLHMVIYPLVFRYLLRVVWSLYARVNHPEAFDWESFR